MIGANIKRFHHAHETRAPSPPTACGPPHEVVAACLHSALAMGVCMIVIAKVATGDVKPATTPTAEPEPPPATSTAQRCKPANIDVSAFRAWARRLLAERAART